MKLRETCCSDEDEDGDDDLRRPEQLTSVSSVSLQLPLWISLRLSLFFILTLTHTHTPPSCFISRVSFLCKRWGCVCVCADKWCVHHTHHWNKLSIYIFVWRDRQTNGRKIVFNYLIYLLLPYSKEVVSSIPLSNWWSVCMGFTGRHCSFHVLRSPPTITHRSKSIIHFILTAGVNAWWRVQCVCLQVKSLLKECWDWLPL